MHHNGRRNLARQREDLFFHQQRRAAQSSNGNGAARTDPLPQGVPANPPREKPRSTAREGDVLTLQKMGYNGEGVAHKIGQPFVITASHHSTPIASRCMGKTEGDTFIMKQPVQGKQREWYLVLKVTPKETALRIENASVEAEVSQASNVDDDFVTGNA